MNIKGILFEELDVLKDKLASSKLETEKLEAATGISNVITLLTQLANLRSIEINNKRMSQQLIKED